MPEGVGPDGAGPDGAGPDGAGPDGAGTAGAGRDPGSWGLPALPAGRHPEPLDAVDAGELPDDIDRRLWFRAWCGGIDYLVRTNPHTFPGRMVAYCPARRLDYNVSRHEITDCSDETKWWVDGYVAGCEPDPPLDDEGWEVEPEHPDYVAWEAHRVIYLETGSWRREVPHS